MPRTPSSSSSPNRFPSSSGFTFLEVLVTLFLVALLAAILAAGLRGVQNVVSRITTSASGSARLVQLDQALRTYAAAVRIPFWERNSLITQDQGILRIPFLDGEESRMLVLDRRTTQDERIGERTTLLISTEPADFGPTRARLVFGPFRSIEIAVRRDDHGMPWGLDVAVMPEDGSPGNPVDIVARFGSIPF
jgi:prepilin-type N-terminal cleavage/methylation domain-containing protein